MIKFREYNLTNLDSQISVFYVLLSINRIIIRVFSRLRTNLFLSLQVVYVIH